MDPKQLRSIIKEEVTIVVRKEIKDALKPVKKGLKGLHGKADGIMEYLENVDKVVDNHEKRLKKIERISVIAHELNK